MDSELNEPMVRINPFLCRIRNLWLVFPNQQFSSVLFKVINGDNTWPTWHETKWDEAISAALQRDQGSLFKKDVVEKQKTQNKL